MRKVNCIVAFIFLIFLLLSQKSALFSGEIILFQDDFEQGINNWEVGDALWDIYDHAELSLEKDESENHFMRFSTSFFCPDLGFHMADIHLRLKQGIRLPENAKKITLSYQWKVNLSAGDGGSISYSGTGGQVTLEEDYGDHSIEKEGTSEEDLSDYAGSDIDLSTFHIKYNAESMYFDYSPHGKVSLSLDNILLLAETYAEYHIKGYVKDVNGTGINGLTITLSGDVSDTHITGNDGYYEFLNLTSENYVVTPSKPGWSFDPPSYSYNPLDANKDNQDFIGIKGGVEIIELSPPFRLDKDAYSFSTREIATSFYKKSLFEIIESILGAGSFPGVIGAALITLKFSGAIDFGMSASSALYYQNPSLKPHLDKNTYEFVIDDAFPNIGKYGAYQIPTYLKTIFKPTFGGLSQIPDTSPKEEYKKILESLNKNIPPLAALYSNELIWYGPAIGYITRKIVVPYRIDDFGGQKRVYIYDPYFPSDSSRYCIIDIENDTFSYKGFSALLVFEPTATAPTVAIINAAEKFYEYVTLSSVLAARGLMMIISLCPVDCTITSENGTKIGYVNGEEINEISGAQMEKFADEIEMYYLPVDAKYDIQIAGKGEGTTILSLTIPEDDTKVSHLIYRNIPVTSKFKAYSAISKGQINYTMDIDADNDGVIDYTKTPDYISHRLINPPKFGNALISDVHNYPNPLKNTGTTFTYFLAKDAQVKIKIYDIANDLVCSLDNLPGDGGLWNEYPWGGYNEGGKELSNGVYIYMIIAETEGNREIKTNKLLILK